MDQSIFFAFLLATALWALIGTEREMPWSGTKPGWASGFGWIRSYALLALLGALTTWMDATFSTEIWKVAGFILSCFFVLAGYIYASFKQNRMGVTSEYAALITYLIGILVMQGYAVIGVILSVIVLILLSAKEYLARLRERFSREELGNSLKFAVIALVVLPLLPDMRYSFLDMANWIFWGWLKWDHALLTLKFFNPYSVWLFVVVMAGVEYIGYILSKVMWDRGGIIASGAVGGMISSTATTAAMTSKSNLHPNNRHAYAAATLIASCIMFIRVIAISAFYNPLLLSSLFIPALIMFLSLSGSAYYYAHLAKNERILKTKEVESYESPFRLIPALQFAGIIVLVKFIAWVGKIYADVIPPEIFNYAFWLISGLADVDAITQTMASESISGNPTLMIAASTILIAVMSNNVVKASIAGRFWEKGFARAVMSGFGISIFLGLCVIIVTNIFF
jgi:uncharacterized membrane protein (DUF4010 family)